MATKSATTRTSPLSFSHHDEDSVSDDESISSDQTGSVPSEKLSTTKEEPSNVQNESQIVKRSKMFVYLAIAIAAATVGTLTYFLTAQNEVTSFQVEVSSSFQPLLGKRLKSNLLTSFEFSSSIVMRSKLSTRPRGTPRK